MPKATQALIFKRKAWHLIYILGYHQNRFLLRNYSFSREPPQRPEFWWQLSQAQRRKFVRPSHEAPSLSGEKGRTRWQMGTRPGGSGPNEASPPYSGSVRTWVKGTCGPGRRVTAGDGGRAWWFRLRDPRLVRAPPRGCAAPRPSAPRRPPRRPSVPVTQQRRSR